MKEIKIKTEALKDFFRRSKHITGGSLLTIYNNVRIDCKGVNVTISKTNGVSWCIHSIYETDNDITASILVNEKAFNALLSKTRKEEITISEELINDVAVVTITDGVHPVHIQCDKLSEFPSFPDRGVERETTAFDSTVLEAISFARHYLDTKQETNFSYLHMIGGEKSSVFGSNMHTLYYKEFDQQLPSLVLSKDACSVISAYQSLNHFTNGNYDFFDVGNTVYGFLRSEYKTPGFVHIIKSAIEAEDYWTASAQSIVDFCDVAIGSTSNPEPTADIVDIGDDEVSIATNNPIFGVGSELILKCKKTAPVDKFGVNLKKLSHILKYIPFDDIKLFKIARNMYAIKTDDDPSYIGAFSGTNIY